jgi:hypothetical protein
MNNNNDENQAQRDSRRILERVDQDSETVGTSSMVRAAEKTRNHFMGGDRDRDDPIEVWGTRIGRGLSLIGVVVLTIYLYNIYFQ